MNVTQVPHRFMFLLVCFCKSLFFTASIIANEIKKSRSKCSKVSRNASTFFIISKKHLRRNVRNIEYFTQIINFCQTNVNLTEWKYTVSWIGKCKRLQVTWLKFNYSVAFASKKVTIPLSMYIYFYPKGQIW